MAKNSILVTYQRDCSDFYFNPPIPYNIFEYQAIKQLIRIILYDIVKIKIDKKQKLVQVEIERRRRKEEVERKFFYIYCI